MRNVPSIDYASFSGPQKAAILMLVLGEGQSGPIFTRLREEEIREVSKAMAQLGPIPTGIVEKLYAEFSEGIRTVTGLVGGPESTQRLLERSLPSDHVTQIMEEIAGPGRSMWDKLGHLDENVLAEYLGNEYPQTVAVVLSKIRPDHAAKVLGKLPDNFATDVIMRLLRIESIQPEVLEGVERTLRTELIGNLARNARRDPHDHMANIFNHLDRKTEQKLLGALEGRDSQAAERVRALMFTFDDLVRIPAQGIQIFLRSVQKDKIAMALKGASQEIRDLFFNNLSERAGKMLREEIEGLGPVKIRAVDEARGELVRVAKELAADGKIEIKQTSEEEVVF